jgi:signal peptidase II
MQKRRPYPALDDDNRAWLRRAWARILLIAAAVLIVDQLTKTWAINGLGSDRVIHVVGWLRLALVRNTGVAFGVGSGAAPLLVAVAIVGFVAVLFGRQIRLQGAALAGVGLVLGGAFGNVADRLFRDQGGAVVDFIELSWWPVFNIADSCIVVGAFILVIAGSRKSEESPDES